MRTGTEKGRLIIVSHWTQIETEFPEQRRHLSHSGCGWKGASGTSGASGGERVEPCE